MQNYTAPLRIRINRRGTYDAGMGGLFDNIIAAMAKQRAIATPVKVQPAKAQPAMILHLTKKNAPVVKPKPSILFNFATKVKSSMLNGLASTPVIVDATPNYTGMSQAQRAAVDPEFAARMKAVIDSDSAMRAAAAGAATMQASASAVEKAAALAQMEAYRAAGASPDQLADLANRLAATAQTVLATGGNNALLLANVASTTAANTALQKMAAGGSDMNVLTGQADIAAQARDQLLTAAAQNMQAGFFSADDLLQNTNMLTTGQEHLTHVDTPTFSYGGGTPGQGGSGSGAVARGYWSPNEQVQRGVGSNAGVVMPMFDSGADVDAPAPVAAAGATMPLLLAAAAAFFLMR